MADLGQMTDWGKLRELMETTSLNDRSKKIDEAKLVAHLKSRVKGQDETIEDVAKIICLNWRKKERSKPICSLLFMGPTGTGKTELAKVLTEHLFDHEKDMIRIDCSELSHPQTGIARLVGMSAGFVGSEQGGQLTRPMFANPKRLILFDEIEKAHPLVFDLLLQLMGDGRLTEQNSGKTADFTQSVIVLTSNAIAEEVAKATHGLTDYHEVLNAIKTLLAEYKIFRPEICGRIDKIYQFKPLEGDVLAEVALQKLAKVGKEFGIDVEFVAPEILIKALLDNMKISKFGIRELERILFDMVAPSMVKLRDLNAKGARFEWDPATSKIVCRELGVRKTEPPQTPTVAANAGENGAGSIVWDMGAAASSGH